MVNFMIRNRMLLGSNVTRSLEWLGIGLNDLKITRSKGAYDPVVAQ
jgi:hypothetical protein